jgi:hypothetical protein
MELSRDDPPSLNVCKHTHVLRITISESLKDLKLNIGSRKQRLMGPMLGQLDWRSSSRSLGRIREVSNDDGRFQLIWELKSMRKIYLTPLYILDLHCGGGRDQGSWLPDVGEKGLYHNLGKAIELVDSQKVDAWQENKKPDCTKDTSNSSTIS